jgi:hypothetical protein
MPFFQFLAIVSLVISIGSVAYSITQAKKMKEKARAAAEARKGFEMPVEGEAIHVPKWYGRGKMGGIRVWHATKSDFIHTVNWNGWRVFKTGLALTDRLRNLTFVSLGRIGGIWTETNHPVSWYATELEGTKFGKVNAFLFFQQIIGQGQISNAWDFIVDESRFLDDPSLGTDIYKHASNNLEAAMRITFFTGGDTGGNQSDDILTENFGERASAVFQDMSFLTVIVKLDRENPQHSGIPVIQVIGEGQRVKHFDLLGNYNGVTQYSSNPVLCLIDYLLDPIGGAALDESEVNLPSFYAAKPLADTVVQEDVPTAGNVWRSIAAPERQVLTRDLPLWETCLIVDTKRPIRENIEAILATMGDARLVWSEGKYKLQAQYPTSNEEIVLSEELTDDDLVLDQETEIRFPDASARLNYCSVKFANEANNFAEDTAGWPPKLTPSVDMDVEVIVPLNGRRYAPGTNHKGWDDATAYGKLLNNYSVWDGNDFDTTLSYIIIFKKEWAGTCSIEAAADDDGQYTLELWNGASWSHVYTSSSFGWNDVDTHSISLGNAGEDKVYRLTATAEDTSGENSNDDGSKTLGRGFALRILKGSAILWGTREPSYQDFVVRSLSNAIYRFFLEDDDYMELETEVYAEGITDYYHALAKAEELVRTSRGSMSIKFRYRMKTCLLEPGDYVTLQSDTLNLGNVNPLYLKIESVKMHSDFTCDVEASRFDYTFLAWNMKDDEYVRPPQIFDTVIPAPEWLRYDPPAVQIMEKSSGTLSWPEVHFSEAHDFKLYMHTNLDDYDASNYPIFREIGQADSKTLQFILPSIAADSAFFGIRTVTKTGKLSDMTITNVTFSDGTDIVIPAIPLPTIPEIGLELVADPNFSRAEDQTYWFWKLYGGSFQMKFPDRIPGATNSTSTMVLDMNGGTNGGRLTVTHPDDVAFFDDVGGVAIPKLNFRLPLHKGDVYEVKVRIRMEGVSGGPSIGSAFRVQAVAVTEDWPPTELVEFQEQSDSFPHASIGDYGSVYHFPAGEFPDTGNDAKNATPDGDGSIWTAFGEDTGEDLYQLPGYPQWQVGDGFYEFTFTFIMLPTSFGLETPEEDWPQGTGEWNPDYPYLGFVFQMYRRNHSPPGNMSYELEHVSIKQVSQIAKEGVFGSVRLNEAEQYVEGNGIRVFGGGSGGASKVMDFEVAGEGSSVFVDGTADEQIGYGIIPAGTYLQNDEDELLVEIFGVTANGAGSTRTVTFNVFGPNSSDLLIELPFTASAFSAAAGENNLWSIKIRMVRESEFSLWISSEMHWYPKWDGGTITNHTGNVVGSAQGHGTLSLNLTTDDLEFLVTARHSANDALTTTGVWNGSAIHIPSAIGV